MYMTEYESRIMLNEDVLLEVSLPNDSMSPHVGLLVDRLLVVLVGWLVCTCYNFQGAGSYTSVLLLETDAQNLSNCLLFY